MARQRACIITLDGQNRLVFQSAYDPIFKDVLKGCPGSHWDSDQKVWYVDLKNAAPNRVTAIMAYITSGVFVTCARDRQLTLHYHTVVRELGLDTLGRDRTTHPTVFNWIAAALVNNHYVVEPYQVDHLVAHLSGAGGAALQSKEVPLEAPYYSPRKGKKGIFGEPSDEAVVTVLDPDGNALQSEEDKRTLVDTDIAQAGSYVDPDTKAELALTDMPDELVRFSEQVQAHCTIPDAIGSVDTRTPDRDLYTNQREFLIFAMSRVLKTARTQPGRNVATLMAHDPSLGKTTTAVTFAKGYPFDGDNALQLPEPYSKPIGKVVVICPERARTIWYNEFKTYTRCEVYRYGIDDRAGARWSESTNGVLVVGFSSIIKESFVDKLGTPPFDGSLLIVDEVHYLSSNKSKRSLAIRKIENRFLHVLLLSGTPILAKPIELYPTLEILDETWLKGGYWRYATRYCDAKKTAFGWNLDGKSNTTELVQHLRGVMHRVRRSAADMPALRRIPVPIDIEDRGELEDAVAQAIMGLPMIPGADAHAIEARAKASGSVGANIRQIVYDARRDESIDWIADWAKTSPGRKLLIFVWNKAVVEDVMNGLTGALDLPPGSIEGVTGAMSITSRETVAKRFREDGNLRFLVCTIASMGDVVSLHDKCSDGVFLQFDWTPGVMKQAELRLGRDKKGEAVNWYYLCAANTVDERMLTRLLAKQETFNDVIDGGTSTPDYDDMLSEILAWKDQYDKRRIPRKGKAT